MQSLLESIKKTAQHVVLAINSVLKIEVAIIDSNLRLIATTPRYLEKRGPDINKLFFKRVNTDHVLVIESPGRVDVCRGCRFEGNCPKTVEIFAPIFLEREKIGVFLLAGFTPKEKDWVLSRVEGLEEFLVQMANLLGSKIKEQQVLSQLSFMRNQLESTLNCIDDGIVNIDSRGIIRNHNAPFSEIMGKPFESYRERSIKLYLREDLVDYILSGREIKNMELNEFRPGKSIIVSACPIRMAGDYNGSVLFIKKLTNVKRMIHDFYNHSSAFSFEDIIGESKAINDVICKAKQIAQSQSTVLITGESGTGKELFARAIHASSRRVTGPFITINCAAIPDSLLESELFGYEEGAFTGAKKGGKLGKFELADNGTLFLDEIGDMSLHLQAKLLRVLEEHKLQRLGGTREVSINVRVIAATNKNLKVLVEKKSFRDDLFYRLNVIPLNIPPLRERPEDIKILSLHFLEKYNNLLGKNIKGFTEQSMTKLCFYKWPGNVRELENAVEYSVNIETTEFIQADNLPKSIESDDAFEEGDTLDAMLKRYERHVVCKMLDKYGSTLNGKKQAAKALGISLTSLYRKVNDYYRN